MDVPSRPLASSQHRAKLYTDFVPALQLGHGRPGFQLLLSHGHPVPASSFLSATTASPAPAPTRETVQSSRLRFFAPSSSRPHMSYPDLQLHPSTVPDFAPTSSRHSSSATDVSVSSSFPATDIPAPQLGHRRPGLRLTDIPGLHPCFQPPDSFDLHPWLCSSVPSFGPLLARSPSTTVPAPTPARPAAFCLSSIPKTEAISSCLWSRVIDNRRRPLTSAAS